MVLDEVWAEEFSANRLQAISGARPHSDAREAGRRVSSKDAANLQVPWTPHRQSSVFRGCLRKDPDEGLR